MQKKTIKIMSIGLIVLIYSTLLIYSINIPDKGIEFYPQYTNTSSEPKLIVAFRNDDPSAMSNISNEKKIIQIFWDKYGIPQTYCIIPNVSADRLNSNNQVYHPLHESEDIVTSLKLWKNLGAIEFCQHGYTHQVATGGEFKGLSYQEQLDKIRNGNQLLYSVLGEEINIFAPPWNQGDINTLRAGEDGGINIYSGYLFSKEMDGLQVINVNAYLDKKKVFPSFEEVYQEAKKTNTTTFVIIWYHSYDWTTESEHEYLDTLLLNITSNPMVEITTIGEIAHRYPQLLDSYSITGMNLYSIEKAEYRTKYYSAIFEKLVELSGVNVTSMKLNSYQSYWRGEYEKSNNYSKELLNIYFVFIVGSRLLILPIALLTSFLLIRFKRYVVPAPDGDPVEIYKNYMPEIGFIGFIILILFIVNISEIFSDYRMMQINVFVTLYVAGVAILSIIFKWKAK